MPKNLLGEDGERALRLVEENQKFHDDLVEKCDKRWAEFEGVLERNSNAARWESQLHPPYLNHIVETQLAGLLDERFSFRVKPMPRMFNPGEYASVALGAKAHEILHRQQLKQDRFNEFQRPYALDAAVCGIGIAKSFWLSKHRSRKRNVVVNAAPPELRALGAFVPKLEVVERVEPVFDGPTTESLDPRDCYWHEAATALEKSRFFAHSVWVSYADLMEDAKAGNYDEAACRELEGATEQADDSYNADRRRRGRKKDMIEVLEVWDREKRTVTWIGARKVVLRSKPWPFWHGQYPFTVVSLQPYPRTLRGMSVVEKLAHLQEAAWDLMNQRIDNVRFLNNAIAIVRSDVDDIDALDYAPRAQWMLEDPSAVQMWTPNPLPAEISLGAESQIKQDMQNLAGSQPFTSTSEARNVSADTATEAALVTNLAQMATKQMKGRLYGAYELIGQQRMELNQQFIREPIYAERVGLDQQQEVVEILPHLLQGDYLFDIQPMNESLNRSERRAEASSRFQVLMQAAPALIAMGVPLNAKALLEDFLASYDEEDVERYLTAAPPQAAGPLGGGQQQGQPETGGQPGGVTAPQSIDPAVSPSTQASLSPEVFMQRIGAQKGGVSNA